MMANVQLRNSGPGHHSDRSKATGESSIEAMCCLGRRRSDLAYRQMFRRHAADRRDRPGRRNGVTTPTSALRTRPCWASTRPLGVRPTCHPISIATMQDDGSLSKTWVRACLFIPTSVTLFAALYVVTGTLVEGSHERVGNAVGVVDFAVLIVSLFFGPVWVLRAWRAPSPPRRDGGPGGDDGPLPMPPSGSGSVDIAGSAQIQLRAEIDDEIRALLDQESVSSSPR